MLHIINELYGGKLNDAHKKVSRMEYEIKELSTKMDIAELFIQVQSMREYLESTGAQIPTPEPEERETMLKEIVQQDRKNVEGDIADYVHEQTQKKQFENNGPLKVFKDWYDKKYIKHSALSDEVKDYLESRENDMSSEVFKQIVKAL